MTDRADVPAASHPAGPRSTADLRRHTRSFGVLEAHQQVTAHRKADTKEIETKAPIAELERLARLASGEPERRLETEPGAIQTRDLTVMAGVAVDKVRHLEDWRGRSNSDLANVGMRAFGCLFEASKVHGSIWMTVEEFKPDAPSRPPGGTELRVDTTRPADADS